MRVCLTEGCGRMTSKPRCKICTRKRGLELAKQHASRKLNLKRHYKPKPSETNKQRKR